VSALIEMFEDTVPNVRREAAEGLGRIGPQAISAVENLTKSTKDSDARVRREAMEALHSITKGGQNK
jgi:HEAT repeat protein